MKNLIAIFCVLMLSAVSLKAQIITISNGSLGTQDGPHHTFTYNITADGYIHYSLTISGATFTDDINEVFVTLNSDGDPATDFNGGVFDVRNPTAAELNAPGGYTMSGSAYIGTISGDFILQEGFDSYSVSTPYDQWLAYGHVEF